MDTLSAALTAGLPLLWFLWSTFCGCLVALEVIGRLIDRRGRHTLGDLLR